jgi:DNA mismatch repair protein MutL
MRSDADPARIYQPSRQVNIDIMPEEDPEPPKPAAVSQPKPIEAPITKSEPESVQQVLPTFETAPFRVVGELFSTYILVQQDELLLIIDKHAAHERILYEKLLRERGKVGGVASQGLLLPMPVSVTLPEAAAAEEARGDLEAVGYSFSGKGNKLYLDAVPSLLSPEDAKDLFLEMLTSLSNGETDPALSSLSRQERALYSVACKAAIKGGRNYDEAHIVWLIEEVLKNPSITVCPHGRPIAMTFTKNKQDREFNRIQH